MWKPWSWGSGDFLFVWRITWFLCGSRTLCDPSGWWNAKTSMLLFSCRKMEFLTFFTRAHTWINQCDEFYHNSFPLLYISLHLPSPTILSSPPPTSAYPLSLSLSSLNKVSAGVTQSLKQRRLTCPLGTTVSRGRKRRRRCAHCVEFSSLKNRPLTCLSAFSVEGPNNPVVCEPLL